MFRSPGAGFWIGPLPIHWYHALFVTAVVMGMRLAYQQARYDGLPTDNITRVGWGAVLAGWVGARAWEVVFNWDYYGRYPSKIPAIWEGGMAIHGALVMGVVAGMLLAPRRGIPTLCFLDIAAPSVVLGQAIGRWGNFFNEEAFGLPTDLAWKMYVSPAHRPAGYGKSEYFHPTFLYESLWDLAVFGVLVYRLRPRLATRPGALFFAYIGLYSIGRFFIEILRMDSFWVGGFRVVQLASVVGVAVSLVGLAWAGRRATDSAQRRVAVGAPEE